MAATDQNKNNLGGANQNLLSNFIDSEDTDFDEPKLLQHSPYFNNDELIKILVC